MDTPELTAKRDEAVRIRTAGDRLALILWFVAAGCLIFTMVNVYNLAVAHKVPQQTAWMVDPIMSVSLLTVLIGDGVLARHAQKSTAWAQILKYAAGGITLTLNVWQPVVDGDHAGIFLHSSVPAMLVILAEVTPSYRRRLTVLADGIDAEVRGLLEEAAQVERTAAARRAEEDRRASALASARQAALTEAEEAHRRALEAEEAAHRRRLEEAAQSAALAREEKAHRAALAGARDKRTGTAGKRTTGAQEASAQVAHTATDLPRRKAVEEDFKAAVRAGKPWSNAQVTCALYGCTDECHGDAHKPDSGRLKVGRTRAAEWKRAVESEGTIEATGSDR